jgi:hypothetical protein
MGRGSILKQMLSSCAGRISYQGGQYSFFPAATVAPTLQLTDADLIGSLKWNPRFSIRDTCNAVKGTYVSVENAYQQADVPAFMCDYKHGYGLITDPGEGDAYLVEDNGERIFKEANFPCTNSSATAQRLEKIGLMRTRYQGRGTLRCSMGAYRSVALDVIQLTHKRYTWVNKDLEILNSRFVVDKSNGAPTLAIELDVAETGSDILDWSITEQLTPQGYAQPDNVGNSVCVRPESVVIYSGPGETVNNVVYPSTITKGADGSTKNSLYVSWKEPNDANVANGGYLEVQWQLAGASSWTAFARFDASVTCCFIPNVSEGASYNVQVRAVNCAAVPSEWVSAGPEVVSDTYSVLSYSGVAVAPSGTLIAQGLADGTAQIQVLTFTPNIGGGSTAACTPNPALLTGLNQSQVYYVYYVDLLFAGGTITPIATQKTSDYLNKTGYFLIGSVTTPSYTPRYQPSTYSDLGTQATVDPSAAYDNNLATNAMVGAEWWASKSGSSSDAQVVGLTYQSTNGNCVFDGFPSVMLADAATLNIVASVDADTSTAFYMDLIVKIGSASATVAHITAATGTTTYTYAIPAGTDLSTVSVQVKAHIAVGTTNSSGWVQGDGFEIFIQ